MTADADARVTTVGPAVTRITESPLGTTEAAVHATVRTRTPQRSPLMTIKPGHVALVVMSGAIVAANVGPINDLDSYWHVELGRQILRDRTLNPAGTQWLADPAGQWSTSQWASEAAMAVLVNAGGWRALVLVRAIAFAAILVTLALTLIHRRAVAPALAVLAVTGLGLTEFIQDRPQTVALVFIVPLGWWCVRTWTTGERPPILPVAALSLACAQFHGMWVLYPFALGCTAAGTALAGMLDRSARDSRQVKACLLAAGASLAGLVNPQGLASVTAPAHFAGARDVLAEWMPSTIVQAHSLGCALLLALVVAGWAATAGPIPVVERLWVGVWALFVAVAYRNALPGLLLLAPAVAASMDRAWGRRMRSWEGVSTRREALTLRALLVLSCIASVIATTVAVARVDPLAEAPVRPLAERLAASPRPLRVFNAYDASGQLVAFGGGKVRLIVDGRFDRWGADYVTRLGDAERLAKGWEETVAAFRPDAFVLHDSAPLTTLLLREGHWRLELTHDHWDLLLPA